MKLLKLFIVVIAVIATPTFLRAAPACPEFHYFEPKEGPLALINCDMHKAYDKRLNQIISTFGVPGGRPIILSLGDSLVLKYDGRTEKFIITPSPYHTLKVFSHGVFSVFLILSQDNEGKINNKIASSIAELRHHMVEAEGILPTLNLSPEAMSASKKLINRTKHFIDVLIANNRWTQKELTTFYSQIHAPLNEALKLAAQAELSAMDRVINPWIAKMTPKERSQIGIVLATVHQARAKELGLQYFAKKCKKKFGEGAELEEGIVVLEGKFDEASALKLLGIHYLDREAGKTIFNDPIRLQRDLLSDATREILHPLTPLVAPAVSFSHASKKEYLFGLVNLNIGPASGGSGHYAYQLDLINADKPLTPLVVSPGTIKVKRIKGSKKSVIATIKVTDKKTDQSVDVQVSMP